MSRPRPAPRRTRTVARRRGRVRMTSPAGLGAALLVVFVLSGRWSLARVTQTDLGWMGEPRFVVAVLLCLLMLAPSVRARVRLAGAGSVALMPVVFFGYMMASAAWAPAGADPMKVAELGLVLVAVLCAIRLIRVVGPHAFAQLLWGWLVPVLALFAVLGVAGTLGGGGRLAILGGGPNVFGRNMGLLAVATLGLALRQRGSATALVAVVTAAALVVLSGSRGALVATILGMLALSWAGGRVRRLVGVLLGALVLSWILLELTDLGPRVVEMFQERVLRLSWAERYDSGRADLYRRAWALGLDAPVLGIGAGGFPVLGHHVYPHNLVLETFCEGGLIGHVLLAGVLGPALRGVLGRERGPAPRDCAAFVVVLVAAQFSGDLFDSRSVFLVHPKPDPTMLSNLLDTGRSVRWIPENTDQGTWVDAFARFVHTLRLAERVQCMTHPKRAHAERRLQDSLSKGRRKRGGVVKNRGTGPDRTAFLRSGGLHQAACRLNVHVVGGHILLWPAAAIACHGTVDQMWMTA